MNPLQYTLPLYERQFVVHLHQATRLHYDLRIEYGRNNLLDWVVPKGPSFDPRVGRLAIRSHDHKMSCLRFEGRIRDGAYGAGPLLIWDTGPFLIRRVLHFSDEETIRRGLKRGLLQITFHGERLQGGWTLRKSFGNWQLRKDEDAFARYDGRPLEDWSIVTGRRLRDL
ncbi:MAG TPA: DNA polymerase ligase N-terminal domain-containing protein [Fimbriimonadaceae bacterium]|nr:DNA polymerase ligase N-terminal domain-containing protein [Fimbriimonadaceae bacterium]